MPDAIQPASEASALEDSIAENFDPTPRAEPVGASSFFADTITRAEPATRTTELPSASGISASLAEIDEPDLYDLGDDIRERENAELRERLLRHELFAEFPRLKGKDTLLYAAAKALDGQLQIRNGSPDEIARVAKLLGKTANDLLQAISTEVADARPNRTAGLSGGSYPPGHFSRFAAREQEPENFIDTIRRSQFERGLYDVRPRGMSEAEAKKIDRERLARRHEVRPVANV